jgi:hypothetical protein
MAYLIRGIQGQCLSSISGLGLVSIIIAVAIVIIAAPLTTILITHSGFLNLQNFIIVKKAREELSFSGLGRRGLLWDTRLGYFGRGLVGSGSCFGTRLLGSRRSGSATRNRRSATIFVETKALLDLAETDLSAGAVGVTRFLSDLLPVNLKSSGQRVIFEAG